MVRSILALSIVMIFSFISARAAVADEIIVQEYNPSAKKMSVFTDPIIIAPVCGNGVVEDGEECELANDCASLQYCRTCKCIDVTEVSR